MTTQSISEVASIVGLSPKTIRYYESAGVIKTLERSDNSYRSFSERDIQRLILVKRARALGLPLSEIRNIVSECIDKGCGKARSYVAAKVPEYLQTVDTQISELQQLRDQLSYMQKEYQQNSHEWQHKLDTCCQIIPIKEDVKI